MGKSALSPSPSSRFTIYTAVALCLLTTAVYWQALECDFIDYDDGLYVTENLRVRAGLSLRGVGYALTSMDAPTWHPVTWLSHMADCQFFGLNPVGHHFTSIFLHFLNALLLFGALRAMTGDQGASLFAAALFAVHPLHVESVVWISERKDLLSTFFAFGALWGYAVYTRKPTLGRYLGVLLLFGLGLMSKPMVVTLPCLFLLMDYWPLGRFSAGAPPASFPPAPVPPPAVPWLFLEKVPLLMMAAVVSMITVFAQQMHGAVVSVAVYPVSDRIANALVAYVTYIGKAFWPFPMTALYPHPGATLPLWKSGAAGLVILAATLYAVRIRERRPEVPVGWFWYLGTLFPVIGLVQVGRQALADRYTYVPLIGLFIILSWQWRRSIRRRPAWRGRLGGVAAGIVLLYAIMAAHQVGYWKDSETFFAHMAAVTRNNYMAHSGLGQVLARRGEADRAIAHYRESMRLRPDYETAINNLGVALLKQGKTADAAAAFRQALAIRPGGINARNNLGNLLMGEGKLRWAEAHFRTAIAEDPRRAKSYLYLGKALVGQGRFGEALEAFKTALDRAPDDPAILLNLGMFLVDREKPREAIPYFRRILLLKPDADAHNDLGVALSAAGRNREALRHLTLAAKMAPDDGTIRRNLNALSNLLENKPPGP